MNKVELFNKATRAIHKVGFVLKKHSPEILVIGGTIGTVVAGVLACKATTKVQPILEEAKTNIEGIHRVKEEPKLQEMYKEKYNKEYDEKTMKQELVATYIHTGKELVKAYAPAVSVAAVSITAILAGNNILRQRAVAYAAAYASVDNSFKEYRERVVDRFGKELDHELRYNIKSKEITEVTLNEDGTTTTETKTVQVPEIMSVPDEFTRCFMEGSAGHTPDPEHNKFYLLQQQGFANRKLQQQGYLFYNDVLEMLGYPKTRVGQVAGWIYDEKNPIGDNYVDFGLFTFDNGDFVNGNERSIWLNFNVQPDILRYMP
jgi:hypothetical protein